MKFLYEKGYSVIDLNEAVKIISSDASEPLVRESSRLHNLPSIQYSSIPQKKVVLTFDDGFYDFYTKAFPILQNYGFSTTVFLPTSFIDNAGKPGLKGKHHLSWNEVRELGDEGIGFGSHTVSHRQLRILSRAEIEYEIKKSKQVIEKDLGQNIVSFCYPYKFMEQDKEFVRMIKTMLIDAGYQSAVTTRIGTSNTKDDIFMLKRIPINSEDGGQLFSSKLEGAYDWLHSFQYLSKMFKRQIF